MNTRDGNMRDNFGGQISPAESLADEIVRLARENGKRVDADTDLAALLEELAGGMQLNVPVLLALSEIATPLFRHETGKAPARKTDPES